MRFMKKRISRPAVPSHAFWPAKTRLGGVILLALLAPLLLALGCVSAAAAAHPKPPISLTLIPPSPVTEQITLDIRASVRNDGETARRFTVSFYLDEEKPGQRLHQETLDVAPKTPVGIKFRWPAKGHAGQHRVLLVAQSGETTHRFERSLKIIASDEIGRASCRERV